MKAPPFSLGIEEEYLVVDARSLELAAVPESMFRAAKEALGEQVSPEFRDCMIEVGTGVAADVAAARSDLARLRRTLAAIADDHGLALLAVSCHPFSDPERQSVGPSERYEKLEQDIGGIARRLVTCGMHVHVGLGEDDELRIDLLRQFPFFLPLVLGLSGSSPFWKGEDTRHASWRLSVFDSIPRTGMPPEFASWAGYRKAVGALTGAGIIEDATKIWWDLRPSEKWPTLEVRIADVMPRLDEALAVAAFIQAVMRMLWRLKTRHLRWRVYDRFLLEENRWRAQRYGTEATLLDLARGELVPLATLLDEAVEAVAEDAAALGCAAELGRLAVVAREGGSAVRQRRRFRQAVEAGAEPREALREVLRSLAGEFREGLEP